MRTLLVLSFSGLILSGVAFAWAGGADPFGGGAAQPADPGPADPFGGQPGPDPFGGNNPFGGNEIGGNDGSGTPGEPPRGGLNRFMPEVGEDEVYLPLSDKVVPKPTEPPVLELGPKPAAVDETKPNDIVLHLERTTKLVAKGHALSQVIEQVSQQTECGFWIDREAFSEIGLDADLPVEMELDGISLRNALRHLLRHVDPDLTFYEHNGVVYVTTRAAAEGVTRRYLFDVNGLVPAVRPPVVRHVYRGATFTSKHEPVDRVIELIQATIAPDSWSDVGGPSTIERVGHTIVVSESSHEQVGKHIETLLGKLHKAKAWDGRDQKVLRDFAAPEEKHWQLLERNVTIEFKEKPLQEMAASIAKMIDVPVQIDQAALREIGLDGNLPVTIHLKNVNLRIGLELMFRTIDPDVTMTFRDGVFLITVREVSEDNLYTRIYPIRDLVDSEDDVNEILESLENTVDPDSWQDVGGPGNVVYFVPSRSLVISQTASVHREVDAFLTDLRAHRARKSAQSPAVDAHPAPPPGDAVIQDELKLDETWPIVVYHVELPRVRPQVPLTDGDQAQTVEAEPYSLEALPKLVQRLTGQQHWQGEHATIELLGEQLIIRQTPAVHNRIEELLRRLELLKANGRAIGFGTGPMFGF